MAIIDRSGQSMLRNEMDHLLHVCPIACSKIAAHETRPFG